MTTRTKTSELPLHYTHDRFTGQSVVFSFAMNDRGIVKGYYIWARQDDMGNVLEKGTVKGIDAIDKLRNEFILKGWRMKMKQKVVVRQPGEKKKEKKVQPVEAISAPPNPHEDKAREEMMKKMQEHDAKMFF